MACSEQTEIRGITAFCFPIHPRQPQGGADLWIEPFGHQCGCPTAGLDCPFEYPFELTAPRKTAKFVLLQWCRSGKIV
jgi:hypothetical protein